jgi:hypothetical protein
MLKRYMVFLHTVFSINNDMFNDMDTVLLAAATKKTH